MRFPCPWAGCVSFGFAVLALFAHPLPAADTVTVATPQGEEQRTGEIVEYTGRTLTLRHAGGQEETLPAASVRAVETLRLPEHVQGDALAAAGKYTEALAQYRAAGAKEPRRWVQRELLAGLARAYFESGNVEKAGASFLVLVRSDADTPYLDAIPLSWRASEPPPGLTKQAQAWLAQADTPFAQLLGASWLLTTSSRADSLATLQKLAAGENRHVARLAEAQLWRTRFVSATAADVERWQRTLAEMPESLRAGPYFLMGKAQSRLQQPEALVSFLRVPILYPQQRGLAAEALFAAGLELVRMQHPAEASRVFEELAGQYPESPLAESARERLQALAQALTPTPGGGQP